MARHFPPHCTPKHAYVFLVLPRGLKFGRNATQIKVRASVKLSPLLLLLFAAMGISRELFHRWGKQRFCGQI